MRWLGTLGMLVVASCGRFSFDERSDGPIAPIDQIVDAPPVVINMNACPALPAGSGEVRVTTETELQAALAAATPGMTILIADGTYNLATSLVLRTPNLAVRSESGDASRVILNGGGVLAPIVWLKASGVTLASVTLANGAPEGIQVEPDGPGSIANVLIYDVTLVDNAGPAVRIRPLNGQFSTGPYADDGTVACSRFVATGAAPGCTVNTWAITADSARGWTIRNNVFDRRACTTAGFRSIWFDTGSRDTKVIDNIFLAIAYSVMLGGGVPSRTYADPLPFGCTATPDHWGGVVCNNLIASPTVPPRTSNDFVEGIALWDACDAWVMHNTIVSPAGAETLGNIEYRFAATYVHLVNNLLEVVPLQRDGGGQDPTYPATNQIYQAVSDFIDPAAGNLRLSASATVGTGASISGLGLCLNDADGKPRNLASPTIGAFER